jgi:hypothetical protein
MCYQYGFQRKKNFLKKFKNNFEGLLKMMSGGKKAHL